MAGLIRYIATMDNRSFIKGAAQNASAMRKSNQVIRGENDETDASFAALGKTTERTRGVMSGFAGAVGLGGLAFGLKDAVEGGERLQVAQGQLQSALRATGLQTKATYDQLSEASERISEHGGFAPEQQLNSIALFVRETKSATQALKLNALATGIARARGMQLSDTQNIVARAYTGSIGKLQQLLGPMIASKEASFKLSQAHVLEVNRLEDVAQQAGKGSAAWLRYEEAIHRLTPQEQALAELQDKHTTATRTLALAQKLFGNATASYANTTQGKINDLHRTIQNLVDTTGEGLLPVLNKTVGILGVFVTVVAHNKVILYGLLGAVAAVSAILTAHAVILELVKTKDVVLAGKNKLLVLSNKLLGTSFKDSKGNILGAVKATEAQTAANKINADSATAGAEQLELFSAANGELAATETEAAASTGLLSAAMAAIPGLALIAVLGLLITHFSLVEKVAVAAWHWIEGAASDAFNWIKGHWPLVAGILLAPVLGPVAILVGIFHSKIPGIVSGAVKLIEGVWHTLEHILVAPFEFAWQKIKAIAHDISHIFGGIVHTAGSLLSKVSFGLFHSGGPVRPKYLASGGPSGTDTVPAMLTPGEFVLNQAVAGQVGMPALNALNAGNLGALGGNVTIMPGQTIVKVDSRVLAQAVTNYTLRKAARGPSGLIGGAMATSQISSTSQTLGQTANGSLVTVE